MVDSVFPAPDSPDTMMLWDCFSTFMSLKALSPAREKKLHSALTLRFDQKRINDENEKKSALPIAKTCGGVSPRDFP